MKIRFKKQAFQDSAVQSVVECFEGQSRGESQFTFDYKRLNLDDTLFVNDEFDRTSGTANPPIGINELEVLGNINRVQGKQNLPISDGLAGQYNLTIEMETGTGKTYVYIKTMFELYQRYGWGKFVVVVPSVAIREGVYKSFQLMEEHFMETYGMKARYFIYNSQRLTDVASFARDGGIQVMIINSQAFARDTKDQLRMYKDIDDFMGDKPMDVIAQTRPIMIIDEPQSAEGVVTQKMIPNFKPLMILRYSATHREGREFNKIYRLDALDAYNQKLVKKITVKGISVKGGGGAAPYLYLERLEITPQAPIAIVEYEEKTKTGIRKVLRKLKCGAKLDDLSGGMTQYEGYVVSNIDGNKNQIDFSNGKTLSVGEAFGDLQESHYRRIQIRETIASHLKKEKELFDRGIKVLSLFFIDEVAKYRQYDESGLEVVGEYAEIFEEEYRNLVNEEFTIFNDPYSRYLKAIAPPETHKGYFSIDKKNRFINSKGKGKESNSDDVSAYDLIMKDKERLLSFEEPTRFIFSHSAMKEGWDNPNVFQICTLKHGDSTIRKRQEVGRGLRLCVNQQGTRIDNTTVTDAQVHDINVLTVIASESYEDFVIGLQKEIAATLVGRKSSLTKEFFAGKTIYDTQGVPLILDDLQARSIYTTLIKKDYLDNNDLLTPSATEALKDRTLIIPEELLVYKESLLDLIAHEYLGLDAMTPQDERKNNISNLRVNDNFYKKEFQELWKKINHRTAYTVDFKSEELIRHAIERLNKDLYVSEPIVTITAGSSRGKIDSKDQLQRGEAFKKESVETKRLAQFSTTQTRYDLVGKLVEATRLTRKTIVQILSKINPEKFLLFKKNPEEFILKTSNLIQEEKATALTQYIKYNLIDGNFDTEIMTLNESATLGSGAYKLKKHIYDYLLTDSDTEVKFAEELDVHGEVSVFAKLPKGFFIATPVGKYNPDWAIVFEKEQVKHIYFIAETKGKMQSMQLRGIEKAKAECAEKHFDLISDGAVRYGIVDTYEHLIEIVGRT